MKGSYCLRLSLCFGGANFRCAIVSQILTEEVFSEEYNIERYQRTSIGS